MNIIEKKLADIKPYEKNPRKNDNAVDAVAASIREFGFRVPVVIDSDGVIVCGHTRYKAAKKLGLDAVPCVIADDLTEEQIKAYRLADNKVAELAEWDVDLLGEELGEIFDIDMSEFGFNLAEEEETQTEREDLSGKVGETYEVIIECVNEIEQEQIYNKLIGDGYSCRVLTL